MDKQQRLAELRKTARCGDGPPQCGLDSVDGLLDMIEHARPKKVLELGCDMGVSTECFLLHCDEVFAMDPWGYFPDVVLPVNKIKADEEKDHLDRWNLHGERFMARCGSYSNLTVIRDYSPRGVLKMVPQYLGYFDLVYIDAVHEYQPILDDIRAVHPLIRDGGWIAGHDYWHPNNEQDTIPLVDGLFGDDKKVFSDGSWLVRRPSFIPVPADKAKWS